MPYKTVSEVPGYVKKLPPKKQKQWMAVFNSSYSACKSKNGKKCESMAFRMANGVAMKDKAKEMQMNDVVDLVTKTIAGAEYPSSDFLVVEDPEAPTTWHLQVKKHGTPDHNLMGAAKAALTVGYRGNKYGGPHKEEALKKLKALYESEKMAWDKSEAMSSFQFVDLTADMSAGKPFDGMAAGKFTDMWGREVIIDADRFPVFVANTQAAIEASKTEAGELVGLPIDASNHDKGDAAGWIVGVELASDTKVPTLRFTPIWTELGQDIISKKIRRKFSPTVDLTNEVVLGGTLTNWPASKSKDGRDLLRPIELAGSIMAVEDSFGAMMGKIMDAFYGDLRDSESEDAWDYHIRDIFEGYLICEKDGALYKVDYTEKEDGVTFSDRDKWVEVKLTYVEQAGGIDPAAETNLEGDTEMTIELSDEQVALIAKQVTANLASLVPAPAAVPTPVTGNKDLIADLIGSSDLPEQAKEQRKAELRSYMASLRQQADLELKAEMARLNHEGKVTELAQQISSGTAQTPRGFRVAAKDLREHMLKLPADEVTFWADLMQTALKDGFIEYAEMGSNAQPKGTVALPVEIATKLDSGAMKVADLSSPILALGDLSQYDLSKWVK